MTNNFNKALLEDSKSKLVVLDAIESLADRNNVKTAKDVLYVIQQYKEVLKIQVASYEKP